MEVDTKEQNRGIKFKKWILISLLLIVILVALGFGWTNLHSRANPIPANIQKRTNFAIYYPKPVPESYKLDSSSISIENGILFFQIVSKDKVISVSEQEIPKTSPDLKLLKNYNTSFKDINASAGDSILGTDRQSGNLVAIIESNTTLININSKKNVPRDVMARLVESLVSLAN